MYMLYKAWQSTSAFLVLEDSKIMLVFFFKQKTAYEMCGRDWSSDVCSSDLGDVLLYSTYIYHHSVDVVTRLSFGSHKRSVKVT